MSKVSLLRQGVDLKFWVTFASRVEVLRDAAVGRMDHWPLLVKVGFDGQQ